MKNSLASAGIGVALSASLSFGAWVSVSSGAPSNLDVVAAMPGHDKVIAAGDGGSFGSAMTFKGSVDGGSTWTALGTAGDPVQNFANGIMFDPTYPDTMWEYGWMAGSQNGLYKSMDGGVTWHNLGHIYEVEGLSVDFSDPQRKLMLAGQHERKDSVLKSTDGGVTWHNIGNTLPSGTSNSEYPLIVDSLIYLVACSFAVDGTYDNGGGTNGIYRTTNGGTNWTQVSTAEVYQNPVVVHDTIYWATYSGSSGGIARSVDKGLTWAIATTSGMDYTRPTSLPNGSIAQLTSTKILSTSANGAAPWTNISTATSINPTDTRSGLTYDAVRGAFFVWQGQTTSIMRFDYATAVNECQRSAAVASPARRNRPALVTNAASLKGNEQLFDISGRSLDPRLVKRNVGGISKLLIATPR